jgi:S-adenosylmethionine synthetase
VEVFDFTPKGIIESLQLRNPIYRATAAYGHFGRASGTTATSRGEVRLFPWEDTPRVDDLRTAAKA